MDRPAGVKFLSGWGGGPFKNVFLEGNVVHRPAGPWTPSVHSLLNDAGLVVKEESSKYSPLFLHTASKPGGNMLFYY